MKEFKFKGTERVQVSYTVIADAETEEEARELFEMYDRDCEILDLSEGTLQIGNFEVDEVEELPEEN